MIKPAADLFGSTLSPDDEAVTRLRTDLARRAHLAGLLDVAYRTLDSPVGLLLLAATPAGLVRVAYARENHDRVLGVIAERISPRVLLAPARLDRTSRQLDEYFAGDRRHFELPVDLQLASGFRRSVLEHLLELDYGSTATYASVAATTGSPRAVRAVGTACANNPVPIVVPCHRVVRSDGTIGQYVGGPEAKRVLLDLEG
ncbi:MAG: methylated-DNA--[protein]-cysteine S-methyltransferase [Acidimicrobiales bacterium]